MSTLIEPDPNAYEKEHRLQFEAVNPSGPHVVVSGLVTTTEYLKGTQDDLFEVYDVHLIVGPWWKDVRTVVPFVSVNGYQNRNADQDDEQGWATAELTWDTVGGGTAPNINEVRIRLKFTVWVKGENSTVDTIGYYLTARGRDLGQEGLDSP